MIWKNGEQYADFTAGEAMFRVMGPVTDRSGSLDDGGCRLLVEAIIRQAVEDYARAEWAGEAEAFFRSEHFRVLTGLNGEAFLRLVWKEMGRR